MNKKSVILTFLMFAALVSGQEATPEDAITRALRDPQSEDAVMSAISAFINSTGVQFVKQYRQLFSEVQDKTLRQRLALALIRRGVKDDIYFDELSKWAKEAIEATAPPIFERDADGKEKKGQFTPEFTSWCEVRKLEMRTCLYKVADYPIDVMLLATTEDPRVIPLLRQGLDARASVTVQMAVRYLGEFHDEASIPLIEVSLRRFSGRDAQSIATSLAWFQDPRATSLIDRYITDQELRNDVRHRQQTKPK